MGSDVGRRQRLLPPAQRGQCRGQVAQRHREVGQEGIRPCRGQSPVSGDGLLGRRQRLLPPTQRRQCRSDNLFK